jgi:hypothetical protein
MALEQQKKTFRLIILESEETTVWQGNRQRFLCDFTKESTIGAGSVDTEE